MLDERVADRLRAAARERPANGVTSGAKHESKRSRGGRFKWEKGMGGNTGEKSARLRPAKTKICESPCWSKCRQTEPGERERMPRQMQDRLQKLPA